MLLQMSSWFFLRPQVLSREVVMEGVSVPLAL